MTGYCRQAFAERRQYSELAGGGLFHQGKNADAEVFFREAARLNPSEAMYRSGLGVALMEQERFGAAEEASREATRLDPKEPDYYVFLAEVLSKQNQKSEANKAAQKAIELGFNKDYIGWKEWGITPNG